MNSVFIVGRMTAKAELKTTSQGKNWTKFTIACARNYTNKDGVHDTDFIECRAWDKTAEFINRYFEKGQYIAVQGSIRIENWTDQKGKKQKDQYILITEAAFCQNINY